MSDPGPFTQDSPRLEKTWKAFCSEGWREPLATAPIILSKSPGSSEQVRPGAGYIVFWKRRDQALRRGFICSPS